MFKQYRFMDQYGVEYIPVNEYREKWDKTPEVLVDIYIGGEYSHQEYKTWPELKKLQLIGGGRDE